MQGAHDARAGSGFCARADFTAVSVFQKSIETMFFTQDRSAVNGVAHLTLAGPASIGVCLVPPWANPPRRTSHHWAYRGSDTFTSGATVLDNCFAAFAADDFRTDGIGTWLTGASATTSGVSGVSPGADVPHGTHPVTFREALAGRTAVFVHDVTVGAVDGADWRTYWFRLWVTLASWAAKFIHYVAIGTVNHAHRSTSAYGWYHGQLSSFCAVGIYQCHTDTT